MRIIYFSGGNFGDELNTIMWDQILSKDLRETPDTALLGLGSLLNESFVGPAVRSGERLFVLGSGAEYGNLPREMAKVEVLAVRGPLTAAVIGRPSAAATDAAILLVDTSYGARGQATNDVVFIPHFQTAKDSRWRDAARMAGLVYVDPRDDVVTILDILRNARLVIAEAMHGAIVADVLRVPWLPVQISPLTPTFKWVDWASSLDLPYEPRTLRPASLWEEQRYARLRRQQAAKHLPLPAAVADQDQLVAEFLRRYPPLPDSAPGEREPPRSWRRSARGLGAKLLAVGQRLADGPYLEAAVVRLQQLAREPGYLSEQRPFDERLNQMREAVRSLEQRFG